MRYAAVTLLLAGFMISPTAADAGPIPARFDSVGADRQMIEALLDTYTRAVSTKNEPLFETLLLNKTIPFSGVSAGKASSMAEQGTQNYDEFRKGVFEGPGFTQRFRQVHINQDGALATVALVFVNTSEHGSGWGWKTLQLLKIGDKWKIASEFYTFHSA